MKIKLYCDGINGCKNHLEVLPKEIKSGTFLKKGFEFNVVDYLADIKKTFFSKKYLPKTIIKRYKTKKSLNGKYVKCPICGNKIELIYKHRLSLREIPYLVECELIETKEVRK